MSEHIIEHHIACPACGAKLKLRLDVVLNAAQEGDLLSGCCGDDLQYVPHRKTDADLRNEAALSELEHTARILAKAQAAQAPMIHATATLNVTPDAGMVAGRPA